MTQPLPHIAELSAYTPGAQPQEDGWIKLNTNENPYPPSPAVMAGISHALSGEGSRLRLYPEPSSASLRAAIASYNGTDASRVICGNGSDDILNLIFRAYTGFLYSAAAPVPTYSLYSVLASIQGAELKEVPMEDMEVDVDKLLGLEANLYLITSPNAPTGVSVDNGVLERLLQGTDQPVVVDEAYSAFAAETARPLLDRYDNLIITRTFSKSHSLAGMRVGYALASPEIVGTLDKIRDSYNLDLLAQVAAEAAIKDADYYDRTIRAIRELRDRFMASLAARGWFLYPSDANFVFVQPTAADGSTGPEVARSLFEYLEKCRILVRYFPSNPLTCDFLRISIGLDEDMESLNKRIDEWQKNA